MSDWEEMISNLKEVVNKLEQAHSPIPYRLMFTPSLYEESKTRKDEILAVVKQPVVVVKGFTDECFYIGDETNNE